MKIREIEINFKTIKRNIEKLICSILTCIIKFFRVFSHGSGNSFHYFYYYGNAFHSGNIFHE